MENLFILLYPLVGIGSLIAYIPQILKLLRAQAVEDNIALESWILWFLTTSISLGYGTFHLKDVMFIAISALGLLCIFTVIFLILYNKHIRFRKKG